MRTFSLQMRRSRQRAGEPHRGAAHESSAFAPGLWKRRIIFATVAMSVAVCQSSFAEAQRRATSASVASAADGPPLALKQLNDEAVSLFDAVRLGDWTAADISLASVSEAMTNLPAALPYADVVAQLRSRVLALSHAVRTRQQIRSLDYANETTRLATEIGDRYETPVPFEISMLAYYGRQLELGVTSRRMSVLKRARVDLRSTWHRIEPAVLRRGDTADARSLTDIVAQLDAARLPADFDKVATAELAVVAKVRQAFELNS